MHQGWGKKSLLHRHNPLAHTHAVAKTQAISGKSLVSVRAAPFCLGHFCISLLALALLDTIRKMKNDFRKMEDEMDRLATNMAVITSFSARISATLQDRHERITKLAGGLWSSPTLQLAPLSSAAHTPFLSPRGACSAAEASVPF